MAVKSAKALYTSLAMLGLITLSGCGQSVAENSAAKNGGEKVSIENCGVSSEYMTSPEKIVALNPGQADLVARLGAGDKVIGVAQTNGAALPESLTQQGHNPQVISEMTPPTREQLLKLEPQLVLSPTTYEFTAEQGYATQDQLKEAGASSYVAAAGCFNNRSTAKVTDLLTDIDAYGKILGKEEDAKKLAAQAQSQLDDAKKRAEGKDAQTVAQLFIEGDTLTAIGAGVEHSIAEAAGAKNAFNPEDPEFKDFFAAEVSREELLKKNPDVIVFTTTGAEHEKSTREWLKKNLGEVKAVQEDRLVAIPSADTLPGTWGNLDAVTSISKVLYPES